MAGSRWKTSPETRLAVALAVSAVFHVILGGNPTQGFSIRTFRAAPASAPAVHVRLVLREPEPPAAATDVARTPVPRPSATVSRRRSGEAPVVQSVTPAARHEAGPDATDPTYYTARELDEYPALATALDLRIPRAAAGSEVSGWVLLRVDVSATGAVDRVAVLEAKPEAHFEEDARRAFASAQFRPALKNGRPVRSRILVHVDYGNSTAGPP